MPDIFSSNKQTARDARFDQAPPVTNSSAPPEKDDLLDKFDDLPPTIQKTKREKMHMFSAFCEKPYYVNFQTQEPDERILLFLRRSNITNIPWMLGAVVLTLLPLLLLFIRISDTALAFFPNHLAPLLLIFYYVIVATYVYINFITWYYNIVLVTDRRIVDIDFADLVYKDVAETTLTLVQDVSYQETGVLRTIFDYGNVLIQTAGTIDNFELEKLPRPERVVEVVESLIGKGGNPFIRAENK